MDQRIHGRDHAVVGCRRLSQDEQDSPGWPCHNVIRAVQGRVGRCDREEVTVGTGSRRRSDGSIRSDPSSQLSESALYILCLIHAPMAREMTIMRLRLVTRIHFKTPFGFDRLQSPWDCVVGENGSRRTSVRLRALCLWGFF